MVAKQSEETRTPPEPSRDMNLPILKEKKTNHNNVVQQQFEKGKSNKDQQKSRVKGSLTQGKNIWKNFIKAYLGKAKEGNGEEASPDANNST